ncbi:MAG TPA: hypothetical protein VFV10_03465 [Gammaproteobacteria bacterium]|nr:hypothetical protein [Gammaproteobacteria bacterium]
MSLLFVSIFLSGYLTQGLRLVPQYFALVPELLSGIALLIVVGRVVSGRRVLLDRRYASFLGLFLFVLLFGFFAQSMSAGAVVSGIRNYAKCLPFFLLPLAYPFTRRQLAVQVGVLLVMLLIQTPLAFYQRFVQFASRMHTGDPIRGMTESSNSLSMLMICAVAVFVALYLRRRIGLFVLLCAVAVYFLPTTINETKGTVVMLPIALVVPAIFMPKGSRSLRRMLPVAFIGVMALLLYAAVYDALIRYRHDGHDVGSFFTQGYVETYLYSGAADGKDRYVGRIDSVVIASRMLSDDPLHLAFGLGAGNVSTSSLPGFNGQFWTYYDRYGVAVTQVSSFLWEIGIVGLAAYLLLYAFVFRDARALAKSDRPLAIYGQVWAAVVIIMTIALMYKPVFATNATSYLFWFYSGVVAREAYVLRQHQRAQRAAASVRVRLQHAGAGA